MLKVLSQATMDPELAAKIAPVLNKLSTAITGTSGEEKDVDEQQTKSFIPQHIRESLKSTAILVGHLKSSTINTIRDIRQNIVGGEDSIFEYNPMEMLNIYLPHLKEIVHTTYRVTMDKVLPATMFASKFLFKPFVMLKDYLVGISTKLYEEAFGKVDDEKSPTATMLEAIKDGLSNIAGITNTVNMFFTNTGIASETMQLAGNVVSQAQFAVNVAEAVNKATEDIKKIQELHEKSKVAIWKESFLKTIKKNKLVHFLALPASLSVFLVRAAKKRYDKLYSYMKRIKENADKIIEQKERGEDEKDKKGSILDRILTGAMVILTKTKKMLSSIGMVVLKKLHAFLVAPVIKLFKFVWKHVKAVISKLLISPVIKLGNMAISWLSKIAQPILKIGLDATEKILKKITGSRIYSFLVKVLGPKFALSKTGGSIPLRVLFALVPGIGQFGLIGQALLFYLDYKYDILGKAFDLLGNIWDKIKQLWKKINFKAILNMGKGIIKLLGKGLKYIGIGIYKTIRGIAATPLNVIHEVVKTVNGWVGESRVLGWISKYVAMPLLKLTDKAKNVVDDIIPPLPNNADGVDVLKHVLGLMLAPLKIIKHVITSIFSKSNDVRKDIAKDTVKASTPSNAQSSVNITPVSLSSPISGQTQNYQLPPDMQSSSNTLANNLPSSISDAPQQTSTSSSKDIETKSMAFTDVGSGISSQPTPLPVPVQPAKGEPVVQSCSAEDVKHGAKCLHIQDEEETIKNPLIETTNKLLTTSNLDKSSAKTTNESLGLRPKPHFLEPDEDITANVATVSDLGLRPKPHFLKSITESSASVLEDNFDGSFDRLVALGRESGDLSAKVVNAPLPVTSSVKPALPDIIQTNNRSVNNAQKYIFMQTY